MVAYCMTSTTITSTTTTISTTSNATSTNNTTQTATTATTTTTTLYHTQLTLTGMGAGAGRTRPSLCCCSSGSATFSSRGTSRAAVAQVTTISAAVTQQTRRAGAMVAAVHAPSDAHSKHSLQLTSRSPTLLIRWKASLISKIRLAVPKNRRAVRLDSPSSLIRQVCNGKKKKLQSCAGIPLSLEGQSSTDICPVTVGKL